MTVPPRTGVAAGGPPAQEQTERWPLTTDVVAVLPDLGDAETGPDGRPLVEVRLLAAPVLVWERSTRHTAELVRELSLLALGQRGERPGRPVDPRLLELSDALTSRFAGISDAQAAVLDDALAVGRRSEDVAYRVPASSRQSCLELADLLDEADTFCEREQLLTEPSPPDQRAFREVVPPGDRAADRRWVATALDRPARLSHGRVGPRGPRPTLDGRCPAGHDVRRARP